MNVDSSRTVNLHSKKADHFENKRWWSWSVKWRKRDNLRTCRVYTAVCDCGAIAEVTEYQLQKGKKAKHDCGFGIYARSTQPDKPA